MNREVPIVQGPRQGASRPLAKLELFVEHGKFEAVKSELVEWATSLSWSEVSYHLVEHRTGVYRGLPYEADATPMVKLEAYVSTQILGRVLSEIERIVPIDRLRRHVYVVAPGEDLLVRGQAAWSEACASGVASARE